VAECFQPKQKRLINESKIPDLIKRQKEAAFSITAFAAMKALPSPHYSVSGKSSARSKGNAFVTSN
jgi:hypothetical protein